MFRLVRKHHDARLVVAGTRPTEPEVLADAREAAGREADVLVLELPPDPELEINALERAATVVMQKPLHADFGLDVATAMWKAKPVVGSLAGGIPFQIVPHTTGYTVDSVEGAAFRIRHLLSNPELIGRMGAAGREHVRRNFLITRHLGDYLALLAHLTSCSPTAGPPRQFSPRRAADAGSACRASAPRRAWPAWAPPSAPASSPFAGARRCGARRRHRPRGGGPRPDRRAACRWCACRTPL